MFKKKSDVKGVLEKKIKLIDESINNRKSVFEGKKNKIKEKIERLNDSVSNQSMDDVIKSLDNDSDKELIFIEIQRLKSELATLENLDSALATTDEIETIREYAEIVSDEVSVEKEELVQRLIQLMEQKKFIEDEIKKMQEKIKEYDHVESPWARISRVMSDGNYSNILRNLFYRKGDEFKDFYAIGNYRTKLLIKKEGK